MTGSPAVPLGHAAIAAFVAAFARVRVTSLIGLLGPASAIHSILAAGSCRGLGLLTALTPLACRHWAGAINETGKRPRKTPRDLSILQAACPALPLGGPTAGETMTRQAQWT
ncbi:hypothetical protein [Sagittula stellata]|uniref:Uncharacterized protein n=1 Tax=Sagittula stellata (strain ATCC 700073 / DSM 11524 / E-37) TaxID=388399 RepID=A3JY44_SAGS3|nr:hypothetical protein [Sagittula stellata]EBA10430.1 hypothetical protein SSE37_20532 [Sagittula stellata E-37]